MAEQEGLSEEERERAQRFEAADASRAGASSTLLCMPNQVAEYNQPPLEKPFSLFVYGTLKCGFRNHGAFCDGALSMEEAAIYGDLYDLHFGFPALVVPEHTIRAAGTTNTAVDITTQHQLNETFTASPRNDGPQVFGELLTFDDPGDRLPKLDHLEGFDPEGQSLYRRVLVPVETTMLNILAWTYVIEKPAGTHLPDGRWPE